MSADSRTRSTGAPGFAFHGGAILTMDEARTTAEVVVTAGDRIAAVGERALLDAHPGAVRVDLAGRTLVPGFIDAHNHLSIAALHPLWADLSGVRTLDELRAALAEQAAREPGAAWIRGHGWNEATGLTLDRADLDVLGFDRPVVLAHYSLHQAVVSSAGLDALGIGRAAEDPPGGRLVRHADGSPNGVLIERAWSAAHARSVRAYHDPARWAELFASRARALTRDGITCVHDAACSSAAAAVYHALARERALPISVVMMPHGEALLSRLDPALLDGPPTGDGDEQLRVGAVKLFADGGAEPAIDVHMAGSRIALGIALPGVEEDVATLVERGFAVAVHAIGNVGLAHALGAFRAARRTHGGGDLRLRVEHAMLASAQQMAEMRALDLVGVVQPGFVDHVGNATAGVTFDDDTWLPFGDLARHGVRLAASSDDPCAFHEPLLTAARGTTRRSSSGAIAGPEQALAYEEWLRAYTAGAAYAGGQEHERGRLVPGLRADLVLLAGALDPENPPTVSETWVGGRQVFASSAASRA